MKNKVVIVYLGNFYFDARCINMSLSLIKENIEVTIISPYKRHYHFECLNQIILFNVKLNTKGALKYWSFYMYA